MLAGQGSSMHLTSRFGAWVQGTKIQGKPTKVVLLRNMVRCHPALPRLQTFHPVKLARNLPMPFSCICGISVEHERKEWFMHGP